MLSRWIKPTWRSTFKSGRTRTISRWSIDDLFLCPPLYSEQIARESTSMSVERKCDCGAMMGAYDLGCKICGKSYKVRDEFLVGKAIGRHIMKIASD